MNDTVVSYGEALLDADDDRIGMVTALGLDEVLMVRLGPITVSTSRPRWSTSGPDSFSTSSLVGAVPSPWPGWPNQGPAFRSRIEFGTLDLSGSYRRVFEIMVPGATLVADPFHVCKLANTKLDECRRRVQNETLGHRGRKSDPLYRCRRLLTRANKREKQGAQSSMGLLRAGYLHGDVATSGKRKGSARAVHAR